MISIDDVLISDLVAYTQFVCDLNQCHGNCCVYGDEGTPLEESELAVIREDLEIIKPYMHEAGIRAIEENGLINYDSDRDYVTPLVNGQECAFARFRNGTAFCAIESAWMNNETDFQKPISCHLYPIRISEFNQYTAVNYHEWSICDPALKNGKRKKTPLYVFAKDALIRKFGKKWYEKLLNNIESPSE